MLEILYVDKLQLAKAAGLDNDAQDSTARRVDTAIDIRVLDADPELAARVGREGGAVSAYSAGRIGYEIITVAEMLRMVGCEVKTPE